MHRSHQDETVGDAVRGVQFAPFDGLLEQGIGVVASVLGLVQGGGEGVLAGLDAYGVGLLGQGGFEGAGVPLSYGFGKATVVLAHGVHGGSGG
ncbi:hypothetical protein [Streptomyces olivaceoviridis]|uniref:hypothetical protein n=1 Tax=Streptomyces olivaceoviridis TaxID=1921 RepID=UPI003325B6B5